MKQGVLPSKNTLTEVHDHLLLPATLALLEVEKAGFNIDKAKLKVMDDAYATKIADIEHNIRQYPEVIEIEKRIEKQYNVNSPVQVRELLFSSLGLETDGIQKTATGEWSTNKKTIEKLKNDHAIMELLHQHRKYGTLRKMYTKPMPNHMCDDGRVHCSFSLNGTVTGRLSSELPNLQQIPRNIKSEDIGFEFDPALNIKHLFVPTDANHIILQADYSQMELRILAEYAQSESMFSIFRNKEDIHLSTGQKMANISGDNVVVDKKSRWRHAAKKINFGIPYGITAESVAEDLKITTKSAQEFINIWFKVNDGVKDYLKVVENYCKEHKCVTSMFGRIRRLPSVDSTDKWMRAETLRKSTNMGIQSTASDYTLSSLINLVAMFKQFKLKSKIIATVHDSIIFDVLRRELKTVADIVQTVMLNPQNPLIYWDMVAPLAVDLECGESWATLEAYEV